MQSSPPPDRFLRLFAHELRNPLAALSTALTLAARPERREDGLRLARRQVDRLTKLVNDVLDAVHLRAGDVTLDMAEVEVDALLDRLLKLAREWAEPRRQPIVPIVAQKGLRVRGDPDRLEQMLANLLHNASKYSPDGQSIEVAVTLDAGDVRFEVHDHGSGLDAAAIAAAFDPFAAQPSPRASIHGAGLGIGLSVARAIAELHDGRLRLHSDGPGHGATASVWLPRAGAAVPARPLHILLVTPDLDLRDGLAALLGASGHDVHCAASAGEALRLADETQLDAIVLDAQLPDARGTDLAARLRRASDSPEPILVALSEDPSGDDAGTSAAAPFDRHFPKPIDPDDLTAYLEIAVARRSSR